MDRKIEEKETLPEEQGEAFGTVDIHDAITQPMELAALVRRARRAQMKQGKEAFSRIVLLLLFLLICICAFFASWHTTISIHEMLEIELISALVVFGLIAGFAAFSR